jgi:hypothetical protein
MGDDFERGKYRVYQWSDCGGGAELTGHHGDEETHMDIRSSQDCDDLIELLRVVRERLP